MDLASATRSKDQMLKKQRGNSYNTALFTNYKFQYGGCNATYYGKTKRHLKVRMCEQLRMSTLTGERVTGDGDSVIKEELLFWNHSYVF